MDSVTQNANGTLTFLFNGVNALFIPTDGLTGYNRNNNTGYGNFTLLLTSADLSECTLSTCDLTLATFDYVPNLGANVFFALLFGLLLIANVSLGVRYKTTGYTIAMVLGLVGEVIGYVGRILLHDDPFDPTGNNFLIYLVPITIAPAFFSAAIYLCLGRIVGVYERGKKISRIAAGGYTLIFCCFDLISLILQAAGGALAATAATVSETSTGVNVMLAGLAFQVFSLVVFMAICTDFAWRVAKTRRNHGKEGVQSTNLFIAFLVGLGVATTFILIRCAYRVAELSGGFHGPLANDQTTYMILEATMIAIATLCLTILHPGLCFQGHWHDADFPIFSRSKGRSTPIEMQRTQPARRMSSEDSVA